jgi:hypothetical protein
MCCLPIRQIYKTNSGIYEKKSGLQTSPVTGFLLEECWSQRLDPGEPYRGPASSGAKAKPLSEPLYRRSVPAVRLQIGGALPYVSRGHHCNARSRSQAAPSMGRADIGLLRISNPHSPVRAMRLGPLALRPKEEILTRFYLCEGDGG